MEFSYLDYCQYLLTSPKNYTLTNLADHLTKTSHDRINRLLKENEISPEIVWKNAKETLQINEEAEVIFDDTVLDKRYSRKIELVRRQYSGNEHRVIRGIGLISCIYVNRKSEQFWVVDYRLYDPDGDEKTKLDHVSEMLLALVNTKKLPFAIVLMDAWYAAQKLMSLIDSLGKLYYCPLKINRLVDDTGGIEKYKRIDQLSWNELELKQGKLIKINQFPKDKKVMLFRVTISTNSTEYIATNDLSKNSTEEVAKTIKLRWKIEEFHREVKQVTGIESCQCRQAIIQKNHIVCCLLVWNFLKRLAAQTSKTVYQLKNEWLSTHLSFELQNPSIKIKLI